MSLRLDLARAMRAGAEAAARGEPLTACPHDPRSEDNRTRLLAAVWMRSHNRRTDPPVDYDGGGRNG